MSSQEMKSAFDMMKKTFVIINNERKSVLLSFFAFQVPADVLGAISDYMKNMRLEPQWFILVLKIAGIALTAYFFLHVMSTTLSFLNKEHHSTKVRFQTANKLFVSLFLATLLYGIGSLVAMMLLLVPALFFVTYFGFYKQVLLDEKTSLLGSFSRSLEYVKGYGTQVFGQGLVLILMSLALVFIPLIIVSLLCNPEVLQMFGLLNTIPFLGTIVDYSSFVFITLAQSAFILLSTVARTVQYWDLKRKHHLHAVS